MNFCFFVIFVWLSEVYCQTEAPANFYLDTRKSARNPGTDNVNSYQFKNDIPLKFIVHGWTEDANRTHYIHMAQMFLKTMDCYVIRVDYSALGGQSYIASVNAVREVGKYVGDFLIQLTKQFNIPMSNVHVIGHSLGGQVSGFVGKRVFEMTGQKVHRITALDPAAPFFENNFESSRLAKSDAEIVDVVHTDAGVLGCARPLGLVDFYPNGGARIQPGCYNPEKRDPVTMLQTYMDKFYCSHYKSYHYFTASIINDYPATKCISWQDFRNGICDQNEVILFGARMPENATGVYYLEMDVHDEYAEEVLLEE